MALAKFDFSYNRAWEDGIRFNTLVTKFESGKEQRRSKGNPKRFFKLSFEKETITDNEAQQMWDFFVARKGKFEPFYWDYEHADDTVEEVKVRFNHDDLNRKAFMNLLYENELEFIEVL